MKELKGSKTEINLYKSFAESCRAMCKYKMYSKQAKKEEYNFIADFFEEMEGCEYQYIKRIYEGFLSNIGDTEKNLKMAKMCSCKDIYMECEKTAREEGFDEIAEFYKELQKIMKKHYKKLEEINKNLVDGTMYEAEKDVNWNCTRCCYMVTSKLAPNKCPMCGAHKGYFKMDKNKNCDDNEDYIEENNLIKDIFKIYVNQKTMKYLHDFIVNCIEKCICYLNQNNVSKKTIYSIYKECMDKCMDLMEELNMDLVKTYDMQYKTHEELKKYIVDCVIGYVDKIIKYMEKSAKNHINRKNDITQGLRDLLVKEKNSIHDKIIEFDMTNCYDIFFEKKHSYKIYIGMDKEEIKKICEKKLETMHIYMDNLNRLGKSLMEICLDIIDDMDANYEEIDEIKENIMQRCMEWNKKMHCYVIDMYEDNKTLEEYKEKLMNKYMDCMETIKEMYMDIINNYAKKNECKEMKERCNKVYDKYMNKMIRI